MDGATEIEAGGSDRRNKGAGKEGATERGEEQGRIDGRREQRRK